MPQDTDVLEMKVNESPRELAKRVNMEKTEGTSRENCNMKKAQANNQTNTQTTKNITVRKQTPQGLTNIQ